MRSNLKNLESWDAPLVSLKRKKIYVKKNAENVKTKLELLCIALFCRYFEHCTKRISWCDDLFAVMVSDGNQVLEIHVSGSHEEIG